MKGYAGKILKVDLSSQKIAMENLDEEMARNYIGGSGFAARIIYDGTLPRINPLAPENVLIFMTGPFTGTNIPTSGRHAVASKSPLTGIWGEVDVGGSWGMGLKRAGYDGIEITGAAEKPVYLWVHDEEAEIRQAEDLWGIDTYRVEVLLKEKTSEKASVACIGPAGESLVKFAAIMHDGRNARAAGRCGLGAVIGSKKLKAIVVSGRKKTEVAHREKLRKTIKEIVPKMRELTKFMKEYGTSGSTESLEKIVSCAINMV